MPIGLLLIPVALLRLRESHGPYGRLDLIGLALSGIGLFGIVWGLIRGNVVGWSSPEIVVTLFGGIVVLVLFVLWELRAEAPMLPMRFFSTRAFSAANLSSLFMFFGMFGSIFLLAQFLQTVQGYSPFSAGLRILPWTVMPIFVAPVAGALSDRIGGRPIMVTGLTLQAVGLTWLGSVMSPTVAYSSLVPGFVVSGIGMALFFAPVANVVLSAVLPHEEGQASGANNAIREAGGVFGVAVLASVFGRYGGYESGQSFVDGLTPAIYVGAAVVFAGALAALAIPRIRRPAKAPEGEGLEGLLERCACADCWGPLVDTHPEPVAASAGMQSRRRTRGACMRAVVRDAYGSVDVLRLGEVAKPVAGEGEVLVRVHAAGVDQGVWHLMVGMPYVMRLAGFGLRVPKNPLLGYDLAGRVEAVGGNAGPFRPGDQVFGTCWILRRVRRRPH